MSLTRIGSIGINTGIAFAGVTTIVTLNTANDALSIGATVNVGSGITLGASGDIFATGVSTVTTLKVGSGVTVSSDGDVFFTGIATGSGSGLTALNATQLTSGTVPTARLGSGTASSSTFLRGDSTFQTVNTDLVSDTSPQLGGDLDTNDHNILLDDSHYLKCGNDTDLQIGHTGSQAIVANTTGAFTIDTPTNLQIRDNSGSEIMFKSTVNGAVELYYDNVKTFHTKQNGVVVEGTEGASAILELRGDQGDDNNDYFRIVGGGGYFYAQNYASGSWETHVAYVGNGAVELYHDNTKKFETTSSGATVTGAQTITGGGSDNLKIDMTGATDPYINFREGSTNKCFLQWDASNDDLRIYNYDSVADLRIGDGGIKFGGDTAAANALDDYEEGTWTASLSSGETCTNNQSTYTRIGRLVVANCYISNFSDFNGNNAEFRISGLPFDAHNAQGGSYHGGGSITYAQSFNYSYPLLPLVGGNNNYIYFHRQDGTTNSWKYQDFHNTGNGSGGQLIVNMIYETDY